VGALINVSEQTVDPSGALKHSIALGIVTVLAFVAAGFDLAFRTLPIDTIMAIKTRFYLNRFTALIGCDNFSKTNCKCFASNSSSSTVIIWN